MPLTIHQDAIGNKYIGYAGDVTNIASGTEISDNMKSFVESFPNNELIEPTTVNQKDGFFWRTDGVVPSKSNYFFRIHAERSGRSSFGFNAKDASPSESIIESSELLSQNINSYDRCVAYSNGIDVAYFAWDINADNTITNTKFVWAGEVAGNSNISRPQTRSGIAITSNDPVTTSIGVKQGDSTTKRIHLDTEVGASHNIDCAEETGRLFLIEDDGAGGDGGTVGYCENLYLSKQTGLTIGGFVTLNGITDGGSTQGIVVGDWGTNGKIIMRVYDGVS